VSPSPLAARLNERYFGNAVHPYATFEDVVRRYLGPDKTLLDAGCGHRAPVLRKFAGAAKELIGVDVTDFDRPIDGITLLNRDLTDTGLPAGSVDVIMSRSVMEHIADPIALYKEMSRLLRPTGHFIFLTGNLWDYSGIIAKLVPNRYHPWIVARTQGRNERDTFPVQYKTNTRAAVTQFAAGSGLRLVSFDYLGQYPAYFLFNGPLFLLATGYEKMIDRFSTLHFLKGWILVVLQKPATG
jgi:SAM-dependent methyltransferase